MKATPQVARVGIRGANIERIKAYIRQRPTHDLECLERVVVVVGGNNICRKGPGGRQYPNESAREVREGLKGLVRFLQTWVRNAEVVTTNLILRESEGGFFLCHARLISRHITSQDEKHHHAGFLKVFMIDSRVKASPKYIPKDFFCNGGDSVHLNAIGYDALELITDWLLASSRRAGDRFEANVHGHVVAFCMKF